MGDTFHQDMAETCKGRVIAAGHCDKNDDGTFNVYGRSIGFNISSKIEDAKRLQELTTNNN